MIIGFYDMKKSSRFYKIENIEIYQKCITSTKPYYSDVIFRNEATDLNKITLQSKLTVYHELTTSNDKTFKKCFKFSQFGHFYV